MIYLLDCFVLLGALTLLALTPSIMELLEDVFSPDRDAAAPASARAMTTSAERTELREEIRRLTTALEKGTPLAR